MDFTPVERTTLSDRVAEQLVARILEGKFAFGEKLPPERDLIQSFAVARPTVREAIRTLHVIGMLDVRPGEGTFVVRNHREFVAKAFGWAMLLDARTASDAVEARMAIECEMSGLAAERATDVDIQQLDALLAQMKRSGANTQDFARADLEFHLIIAGA